MLVLGADEYLKRQEGKIRKCLFFYVKYSKITVCGLLLATLWYMCLNCNAHSHGFWIKCYFFYNYQCLMHTSVIWKIICYFFYKCLMHTAVLWKIKCYFFLQVSKAHSCGFKIKNRFLLLSVKSWIKSSLGSLLSPMTVFY